MPLAKEHAEQIPAGALPLGPEESLELAKEVPDWKMKWDQIERDFEFEDFEQAIGFVNKVAGVAEEERHHPDIRVSYNKVHLELSTHSLGGLTKNDFIVAAKISQLA